MADDALEGRRDIVPNEVEELLNSRSSRET